MNTEQSKKSSGLVAFLNATDHKEIGRFFISGSALVLFASIVGALVSVYEASNLNKLNVVEDTDQYIQLWSISREALLFGGLIPFLVGLAVYLVPLQTGVSNLAFPRGLAASFWTWLLGLIIFVCAYLMNGGPAGGREDFILLWILSLAMMISGLIWAMINVITTLLVSRAQGMSLDKVPFTSWSFLVFCFFGILILPILIAELAISYLQVKYGQIPVSDSQSLLAIVTPLLRAPFVFWIGIPVLGIGADIIGVHTERPVKRVRPFMMLIGFVGLLSAAGGFGFFNSQRTLENEWFVFVSSTLIFLSILFAIALPIASLIKGKRTLNPAMLGILSSGILLLVAADISILDLFASVNDSVDINPLTLNTFDPEQINGSVLSIEGAVNYGAAFILVIGSVMLTLLASAHHWSTKLWGRQLSRSLSFISVVAALVGSLTWALANIMSSLSSTPSEVAGATFDNSSEIFGDLAVAGCLLLAGSAILFLANLASMSSMKIVGSKPTAWEGLTLEWATASPPVKGNFATKPVVKSAVPLTEDVFVEDLVELESAESMPALNSGSEV